MLTRPRFGRPVRAFALVLFALLLVVPTSRAIASGTSAPAKSAAVAQRVTGSAHIDLPDGFAPEGIAISGHYVYSGSRVSGDIYAADLRTGRGRVFSTGPGTPSLGLKVGADSQLFVSGGSSGSARVVDLRTGVVLGSVAFTSKPSFVNDVILTGRTAWFTDSLQAQLYGLRLDKHGRATGAATTLPLTGDWQQAPDVNNANGISTTPDGKALLVVQSNTGFLFRVNPRTGVARRVDLGRTVLTNGDGLLRRGRTLYATQNQDNLVAEVRLSRDGRRGTLRHYLGSPDFDIPTTIAPAGRFLYLPNARFSTPVGPGVAYWITRIRG